METTALARFRIQGSGSHSVQAADGGNLVVEWYDFGPHAPYESANMLTFNPGQQQALARALGMAWSPGDLQALAQELTDRFASYFEVREFAEREQVAFARSVDFMP